MQVAWLWCMLFAQTHAHKQTTRDRETGRKKNKKERGNGERDNKKKNTSKKVMFTLSKVLNNIYRH